MDLQAFPAEIALLVESYLPIKTLIEYIIVSVGFCRAHCYESKHLTVSPSILTRLTGNCNSFWSTIEKAFMGDFSTVRDNACVETTSIFERVFKLLQPVTDVRIPKIKYFPPSLASIAGHQSPPALPSWKLACVLRDRSGTILMGCRLCSQLDVFTERMRRVESAPTQLRTWVVPCTCAGLVHRRCLEQKIKLQTKQGSVNMHQPGVARGWISYDTAAQDDQEVTAEGSLGICARCSSFYVLGFRLPTVSELISVTWQDNLAWRRAGDCILMWLMGIAIVSLSEALYLGQGALLTWPKSGGHVLFWWMFQYVISLNIFLSPRFARIVDLIWLGPVFGFYARLYGYFILATFGMCLTFTPLPERLCPWAIHDLPFRLSLLLAYINFAVLFVITSIVIFLFWKTNYRIPTVADLRQSAGHDHPMLSIGGA